ncbi:hypothetical protein H2O64_15390 [Kordia sp. YSTF-M3]|uniref:DUF6896 domain-containing protein n=1 Tax=Kordia aestuariivivens TaxID=2759037 RepID=A0ABR7QBW5_9FLAO|nr:hypothetical protein [Kordia aestuariivivens]MBC8756060.1 hypothetical protein [Kordia aestuariivivens]
MENINKFKILLSTYLKNIHKGLHYLEKFSNNNSFYQEKREGFLDTKKEIHFQFHGTGCYMEFDRIKIDFNLPDMIGGKITIDPFFIIEFWKINNSIVNFEKEDEILNVFNFLISEKNYNVCQFNKDHLELDFPYIYNLFGDKFLYDSILT